MLINLSNHPLSNWSEKQRQAAEQQFGQIVNLPFPTVPTDADLAQVILLHLLDHAHRAYGENARISFPVFEQFNLVVRDLRGKVIWPPDYKEPEKPAPVPIQPEPPSAPYKPAPLQQEPLPAPIPAPAAAVAG